jgi:hypothetical protein
MHHNTSLPVPGLLLLLAALACSGNGSTTIAPGSTSGGSSGDMSSGSSGGGSSGGASSSGSSGGNAEGMPTYMPKVTGTCPEMSNLNGSAVAFAGQQATVWSGDPGAGPGLLLVYYYATGSNAMEPVGTIGRAQIDAIKAKGGAIVAQNKTTARGTTTGNEVWFTGDEVIADEIVACAIQKQKIDPRHIHVAGYSAGGIQTTYMWFARSGYVASVLSYSGGDVGINTAPLQDPAHPPAALVAHGAKGLDTYGGVVDFFDTSATWIAGIKKANGFAIGCNDGGNHTDFQRRTKIAPQAIQFFIDHPYGVKPAPYTALPSDFPAYCSIK